MENIVLNMENDENKSLVIEKTEITETINKQIFVIIKIIIGNEQFNKTTTARNGIYFLLDRLLFISKGRIYRFCYKIKFIRSKQFKPININSSKQIRKTSID